MIVQGSLTTSQTASAVTNEKRLSAGMIRYPDVSQSHIAFIYANNIWLVRREGGVALPVIHRPGQEGFPKFSPDGQTVAFTANFGGNRDLYTVPVKGGVPVRVLSARSFSVRPPNIRLPIALPHLSNACFPTGQGIKKSPSRFYIDFLPQPGIGDLH